MITVYCWLLCLYPGAYRYEFGEEMTSVFRDAQGELPGPARVSFYGREFCGLLSGALRVHFDRLFGEHLFGPGIPFRRFDMQPQFRFPRSTVFLMMVIFGGVVLTIRMASSVAGDSLRAIWPSLISVLLLMLLGMSTAAAVVWGILHSVRRSGVHRLENVHSGTYSVESNSKR
jgi:hypothetical protein